MSLLSVTNLTVTFPTDTERVNAVRGMNFDVAAREVVALVGESGSGKSATAMAIIGLLPEYAEVSGSIRLHGDELLGLSDNQMSQIRGKSMSVRLASDGRLARVHARDASWFQWPLLEAAIEGNIVADFPLCNKSFNCSYSGHDL